MKQKVKTDCVVLLDTMYGGQGEAPGMYRINPHNHSGKRLYHFLGDYDFWCTNSCREYMQRSTDHGTPDPEWVHFNLGRVDWKLLLVCGNVAKTTFSQLEERYKDRNVLRIAHPAARNWTKLAIQITKAQIESILK